MDTVVVRSLAGIDGGRGEDEGSGYKGSCMAVEHGGKRRTAAVGRQGEAGGGQAEAAGEAEAEREAAAARAATEAKAAANTAVGDVRLPSPPPP